MLKALVLADLDDTLFQTRRKIPRHGEVELSVASVLSDGAPSGYATPVQRGLLALFEPALVVPVTARGTEALSRVRVAGRPAVCANGGRIIGADGGADARWHARLERRAAAEAVGVAEVHAAVEAACAGLDVRRWSVAEDGLGLYVVVKANGFEGAGVPGVLQDLHDGPVAELLPDGWRTHLNGNNLALSPPWLAKRDAVAYLLPSLLRGRTDLPVIGLGDSLSDTGFMDLCHYAMMPTGSQLWRALGTGPWTGS